MFTEMESPWAGDGRGVVMQKIFSRDGTLLATAIQEVSQQTLLFLSLSYSYRSIITPAHLGLNSSSLPKKKISFSLHYLTPTALARRSIDLG